VARVAATTGVALQAGMGSHPAWSKEKITFLFEKHGRVEKCNIKAAVRQLNENLSSSGLWSCQIPSAGRSSTPQSPPGHF